MGTVYEVRYDPATRKWQAVAGGEVRFEADKLRAVEDWLDFMENQPQPSADGPSGSQPPLRPR